MLKRDEQYLFTAVKMPTKLSEILFQHQQTLLKALKGQQIRCKPMPRRLFIMPLFDFGITPTGSEEAAELSISREVMRLSPLEFELTQIEPWPSAECVEQIVVRVENKNATAEKLREAVKPSIQRFGFQCSTGDWVPIVPLLRIAPKADGTPMTWSEIDLELPRLSENHLANSLTIFGKRINASRSRFTALKRIRFREDALEPSSDTEVLEREQLKEILKNRIAQRKLRFSETRRAERNRALRKEENSIPPQPSP